MMRRAHPAGLLGLTGLCTLLAATVASNSGVAIARGGDEVAKVAKGKHGKLLAAPRFEVPEHILAPPRPAGSATLTFALTGRLVMRGCFTSAWSNGRKVKCPPAVLKECVQGRTIEVYAPYARIPRQFVNAGADGKFTATVEFEDDYQELFLKVAAKSAQSRGLRIICDPGSLPVDISEAPPE